jgi:predicted thioesterase
VIVVEDRKVTFQIEARDAHEVIVRGLHKRAGIRTESFSHRVKAKTV